jgi:methylated-DNA-[protein]-cysteine S-methyltransferase
VLISRQGVIIKTDWEPGASRNPAGEHELNGYWQNPDKPINVKLLKQGSVYRNQVWAALCRIPFGETLTYSALAKKIGSSARAVGNACRDNPYALFIPCHRVVSVAGMGGYCGQTEGDLMAIKYKLLEFEAGHKK